MTTDCGTGGLAWIESLSGTTSSNKDDCPGNLSSADDWLASLSSMTREVLDQERACSDVVPGEGDTSENGNLSWLVELGFAFQQAKEALEMCDGDADEALLKLRQQSRGTQDASNCQPAAKRRRAEEEIEIEGFKCIRRGRELLLRPPDVDVEGPLVGKVRPDDSFSFHGVDEWALELYNSKYLQPDIHISEEYDSGAASEAMKSGSPWSWKTFASAVEVQRAHAELESMYESGALRTAAADTAASTKARSDHVCFFALRGDRASDSRPMCPPGCLLLFQRLEAMAARLHQWPVGDQLLFPCLGMAAVYDGKGSSYAAHRDNEFDQGRWLNYRALTALTYINPSGFEDPNDGGMLRCYIGAAASDQTGTTANRIQDIMPRGGTAVLFPSRVLLHEVMPSHARRYALTLWLLSAPPAREPAEEPA